MRPKHTTARDHLETALENTDDTETRYHIRAALQYLEGQALAEADATNAVLGRPSDD